MDKSSNGICSGQTGKTIVNKALSRDKGGRYCAEIISDFKAHPLGHSSCAMFQGWNAESRNEIKQELLPLFIDSA